MDIPTGRLERRSAIRHNEVLRRNILDLRHVRQGIETDLFESRPTQRQTEEHALSLRAVVLQLLGQQVVEIRLDTQRLIFLLVSDLANDLGLYRARCREDLHDGVGLEADSRLHDHVVVQPTSASPRLVPVLGLYPEVVEAILICTLPVLPGVQVLLKDILNLATDRGKLRVIDMLCEVRGVGEVAQ